jgi:hypothetical protein
VRNSENGTGRTTDLEKHSYGSKKKIDCELVSAAGRGRSLKDGWKSSKAWNLPPPPNGAWEEERLGEAVSHRSKQAYERRKPKPTDKGQIVSPMHDIGWETASGPLEGPETSSSLVGKSLEATRRHSKTCPETKTS